MNSKFVIKSGQRSHYTLSLGATLLCLIVNPNIYCRNIYFSETLVF